jgi:exopolyphosphatase / guanosine-5'-triphosphate,3'-diphosphate pyrophosphatase
MSTMAELLPLPPGWRQYEFAGTSPGGIRIGARVREHGTVTRATLAAIDLGSNAMRLRIVAVREGRRSFEIASQRAAVRLGAEVFAEGRISRATLAHAADSFRHFRDLMDEAGVDDYRAVATSATREAANRGALVRAAKDAGLFLEVIEGDEEARLVRSSLRRSVALEGRTVTADIGGGSTEVAVLDDHRVVRSTSLPLGTLRLSQETRSVARASGVVGAKHLRALTSAVERSLAKVATWGHGADRFVATGGTARALAKLCPAQGDEVLLADVERVTERLRVMTDRERVRAFGLRADRADTIVPGALVIARVAAAAGARSVIVPAAGVRDGILADLERRALVVAA